MREVYVTGIGITSFTRLEYPLVEIAAYPGLMALKDSGLKKVDHLYVANMGAGRINAQTGLASAVVEPPWAFCTSHALTNCRNSATHKALYVSYARIYAGGPCSGTCSGLSMIARLQRWRRRCPRLARADAAGSRS
jgi:hypothetical protein